MASEVGGRRVRVELADGFNFIGVVVAEYVDSRGRRTLRLEDRQGNDRLARPDLPHVDVVDLEDEDEGRRGGGRR